MAGYSVHGSEYKTSWGGCQALHLRSYGKTRARLPLALPRGVGGQHALAAAQGKDDAGNHIDGEAEE